MQNDEATELFEFIEASKSKGASDEFLASFLARRGWPQEDVYNSIGAYWEKTTGLAAPVRTAGGESSRDAFLYLLSFATLATWTTALGSMLFRFIEQWIPDPVSRTAAYNIRGAVTWQMASVAVAFPIFLLVTRTILTEAQRHPERLQSGVRKWLTYIALLLTAGGAICDLIWFLDYFLTGELTARFVLKVLTVLLICASVGIYYIGSLRWDRNTDVAQAKQRSFKFAIGAALIVAASFCVGLSIAGTPSAQRRIEADTRRVGDLRSVTFSIRSAYKQLGNDGRFRTLPASLTELIGKGVTKQQILDPETKKPYEYRVQSATNFQLCAIFSDASENDQGVQAPAWHHGKGRSCFTLDASQTGYPY